MYSVFIKETISKIYFKKSIYDIDDHDTQFSRDAFEVYC